jgi:hypothetical protein
MLAEFEALETRNPRHRQRVTQVIHHLLRNQFLHVEDRGSANLFEVLAQPQIERLVADYFEVAGYHLVVREAEGWAGILPDLEQISLPRMRIEETLMLLLLRRLWEEQVQEGSVERYGSVLLSLNAAYDAYQDMVARARRPALSIGDFRALLLTMQRRALVRLGEPDEELEDIPLTIRALIVTVTGDDVLAHLEQLLAQQEAAEPEDEAGQDEEELAA